MFKILKNIIKIILIPFIILIKALLFISGIIIKLLTSIVKFSSILCFGISLGLTCLCSLISILLIVFNFFTEKKLPVLTFIVITLLGALCASIIYFVFYKGIYCVTDIGVLLIEKSFFIPIWRYWINNNQFQTERQSKEMKNHELKMYNNVNGSGELLLNVPFSEKDEVKKLGAWWNPQLKKWYVKNRSNYKKFKKWISKENSFYVVCDELYIVQGEHTCFKCGKKTKVIAFGINNYIEFENNEVHYHNDVIHIASHIEPIPNKLMEYIKHNYNYKKRYSNFANRTYLANCCDNCDVLQGEHYLFNEPDSPFWLENEETISKLKLLKIPLEYDIVFNNIDVSFGSNDDMIEEFADIEELDFTIA